MYRLENEVYIFHTNYNLYETTWSSELGIERFYIYVGDLQTWVEFVPQQREFEGAEMPQMMKDVILFAVDFWIPLENGKILITGKNFDGEEKSRVVAGGLFLLDIPAKKILKLTKAGKGILRVLGESSAKLSDDIWKVIDKGAEKAGKFFLKNLDNAIAKLKNKAKYVLEGTGEYSKVKGHHPLAKKAFEGVTEYDYNKVFSVSPKTLQDIWEKVNPTEDIINVHNKITGQQISLYTAWRKANPNKTLGIDDMAEIEIKAMINVGIPEDIATGWVVKALEDLKEKGVTTIKNIPWNGVNN